MSAIFQAFRDADLRKKILITIALIILYRIGAQIPSPGVDYASISGRLRELTSDSSSVYSLINLFSGGALLQLSIFAIGVMPYITASIIVQLLTVVIPKFEELKKEGQSGQAKMDQYTRYLTLGLALLQSSGIVALADREQLLGSGVSVLKEDRNLWTLVMLVLVMSAGAILVMWLGEIITERGIGNGMSLLIFAGIATRIPSDGANILNSSGGVVFAVVLVAVIVLVVGVVFVEQGQRRIPVQYAKRMVGRRQYGGSSTYLPLKVNQAGVIPVIFASSLIYMPVLITQIINSGSHEVSDNWWQRNVIQYLQTPSSWQYIVLYFALIIFFSYFYVSVQYDPNEQAENMKKYGGFIPGIRPGRPTAEYLGYVMNRLLFVGALYLGIIAVLPNIALDLGVGASSAGSTPFGGTAILIMVSVALTTVKQIESQLLQSNYEGLLK
ncbi:preprotein translocase subunit SecY [Corynebacterium diphtheriae bv. mitis]|uniref:preprotein translocase subunit SecY n=1 Tax=Corynebacterium diphtheriae TaxID=1717 RepID=UPI0018C8EEC8|nr:preprotein translocase subunit SecY [Corynebacterium diphtheriae]MBG9358191.1 preprotein translocase subunit SecY [Corynebacterium diphtheriae bv. mitis]MBG9360341.1 preprotein translocase subunit SecY [Corynebacterium diphtheriae bv. mitis]MBG9362506.1 preprotein translocase subunit SecY [Corynebacterium diphtheriae bv. mitis]MBG9364673.1 preprotein translocase subunit SecY [Corynebacterium diphtheriae bv. mitis]UWE84483.1 preprotein translocase subunit SecY [Corynebacterium diphtheriae bv